MALAPPTRRRYARLSVGVGVSLLVIKAIAAALTGSKAILGDALESIVNVVASLVVLLSIRIADEPADANHPFGHGRVEALSAGLEGALLVAAAVGTVWAAWPALLAPRPLEAAGWGLGLVAFATAVNFIVGRTLVGAGRRLSSMALGADGRHLIGDAITSVALLAGVGLAVATGVWWLDPVIACVLAIWVATSGVRVLVGAVRSLMNEQSAEDVARVTRALRPADDLEGLLGTHDLRILDAGRHRYVQLRIDVPAGWSLERADALARRVETKVVDAFSGRATAWVKPEPSNEAQGSGVSGPSPP